MKAIRTICFTILLLMFFYPFLASQEYLSLSTIAKLQSLNKDALYGSLYNHDQTYFKFISTIERDPKVLALGTSRVLEIRDLLFEESEVFYNAGFGVSNINQFSNFVLNLENNTPEVLIIALDHNFFNETWNASTVEDAYNIIQTGSQVVSFKTTVTNMTTSMFNNQYSYSDFLKSPLNNIGIRAFIEDHGFRYDGSYYYGNEIENPLPPQERVQPILGHIENSKDRFAHGDTANQNAIDMVENLLEICTEKNIQVVAFIPPLSNSANESMKTKEYSYIPSAINSLDEIFEKYNFEFYNYIDASSLGCDDSYFIDGFHCGEVVHLRMHIDMIEQNSILQNYSNLDALKALDENRVTNLKLV